MHTFYVTWFFCHTCGHRKQFSKVLEEQVKKVEIPQMQFVRMVEESKKAAEEDWASQQQEQEEERKHKDFLMQFRNHNKMVQQ